MFTTGKTAYIEPFELVEPTNELSDLLMVIRTEENKIYAEMCLSIAVHSEQIRQAVVAVAELDVVWGWGEWCRRWVMLFIIVVFALRLVCFGGALNVKHEHAVNDWWRMDCLYAMIIFQLFFWLISFYT